MAVAQNPVSHLYPSVTPGQDCHTSLVSWMPLQFPYQQCESTETSGIQLVKTCHLSLKILFSDKEKEDGEQLNRQTEVHVIWLYWDINCIHACTKIKTCLSLFHRRKIESFSFLTENGHYYGYALHFDGSFKNIESVRYL